MRRRVSHALMYLMMFIIAFLVLAPLAMLLLASFKTPMEIALGNPFDLPEALRVDNFVKVYHQAKIGTAFKNSMILSLLSVGFNILLGTMTAYVLIRYEFKCKKLIMGMFMFAMVLPFYTTEIARFQIINKMGLYNSLMAPLVIYIGTDMMQIYIYAQYIEKIPFSLEEAAMIDGASFVQIFWKIVFPMLLPASSTLGIIKFVEVINDMYIPYLYMPSSRLTTLSTALMKFAGQRNMDWGKLSAAILFVLLPTMVIYLIFQRTIMDGMTCGAVKE
ncbi:carbohydrate ABC transporter permease [Lachnoclostridium sp.]|uniref:carbohydrate ABC transporter permease n=1 Tax=Lachnoclostridium sp. TaxID=2028282 RepID=UPI0028989F1C|nr:carbohydrate ABC transporter permease [Lachnoclostridium sp.]